ncbi:MAG: proteasome subunit beta [Candidatus Diapherotrites archaeon]|nr:proteasome subunit beta [Candidatus Diapherotrites archaeon]
MTNPENVKTGTTTVGLVYKDGVVLAADMKATMGHLSYDEEVRKVYPITNNLGVTIAGSVGDALTIVRFLKSHAKMFEIEREGKFSPKAAAVFLSNILNGNRYYPYMVQLIIGGFVKEPELYDIDPSGGLLERKKYAVTGSGTELALGTLDHLYSVGMTEEQAISTAIKAVEAAKRRDVYSGGLSVTLLVINKDGVRELNSTEIKKYLAQSN